MSYECEHRDASGEPGHLSIKGVPKEAPDRVYLNIRGETVARKQSN